MSALNYIRPIPSIDGIVRDIWAKCEGGHFDYGLDCCGEIDSDDIDVRSLVLVLGGIIKENLHNPSMVEVNAANPYKIESPQFVFRVKSYDERAATWTDGARRIEIGDCSVLYCEAGNLEATDGKGGHYLCLW